MKLLIHFQPGARGDFLASILLDSWIEEKNGKLYQPFYQKIHHINHHGHMNSWDTIKNFKGIKIRIDPGIKAESLLLIELNHLIKNNEISNFTDVNIDTAYRAACYYVRKERSEILLNKNLFDYWVNFDNLYNLEYLKNLYYEINNKHLTEDKVKILEKNIDIQPKLNFEFQNLSRLLQFEINNNLLNCEKYFNMFDNLNQIEKFLDLKYYSDKNF